MNVLVTDYLGPVGRHLARSLKREGHKVYGASNCRTAFQNDLTFDLVLHCAKEEQPAQQLSLNSLFFDWLDRTKPERVVYFSSTDVYPKSLQQEPYRLTEDDAMPDTQAGGIALAAEHKAAERGCWVFRPFEVYGEGSKGVFERVARMVRAREDPFRPPGCGQVLDFTHANDVVGTVMELLRLDEGRGTPVNLCTGVPTAVDELAIRMFEATGWEPKRLLCDVEDEVFFRCGSPERMNRILPATVSLRSGIVRHL